MGIVDSLYLQDTESLINETIIEEANSQEDKEDAIESSLSIPKDNSSNIEENIPIDNISKENIQEPKLEPEFILAPVLEPIQEIIIPIYEEKSEIILNTQLEEIVNHSCFEYINETQEIILEPVVEANLIQIKEEIIYTQNPINEIINQEFDIVKYREFDQLINQELELENHPKINDKNINQNFEFVGKNIKSEVKITKCKKTKKQRMIIIISNHC
jgi:hypothetical protein